MLFCLFWSSIVVRVKLHSPLRIELKLDLKTASRSGELDGNGSSGSWMLWMREIKS